jgi:hypothetical protein
MNGRLSLIEFGRQLLDTEDLDPVYVALHRAELDRNQLSRWLLPYWCFYHAGVASYISEVQDRLYWELMALAAGNDSSALPLPIASRWPRGKERRHFRGLAAIQSVSYLAAKFPAPEEAIQHLIVGQDGYYKLVGRIQQWPQFGPWIAFKAVDMLERLNYVPGLRFPDDIVLYDQPLEAAKLYAQDKSSQDEEDRTFNPLLTAIQDLYDKLGQYVAPPRYERKVDLQEYETMLCKWKSHRNGHYPIGNDIRELHEALEGWRKVSPTAEKLSKVQFNYGR